MFDRLDVAACRRAGAGPPRPGLRTAFADLAKLDDPLEVQRIHGDYHLGQVMRTHDRVGGA